MHAGVDNPTSRGTAGAAPPDALFAPLYEDLHRMARRELSRGHAVTLGATTLLHEAYVNMAERPDAMFPDRARFIAYAARVMRGLVIEYARRRQAVKRGGRIQLTTACDVEATPVDADGLMALSTALDKLAEVEPGLAEIVDLKFFCGYSVAEIAALRGVTTRTIHRQWEKARVYLHHTMRGATPLA